MAFTVDWPGEVPMKFETLAPPTAPLLHLKQAERHGMNEDGDFKRAQCMLFSTGLWFSPLFIPQGLITSHIIGSLMCSHI